MTGADACPLAYDRSGYEMGAAVQGAPYPVTTARLTGLDVPYGSEIVIEPA
jgi:UbiD family decarboxylase